MVLALLALAGCGGEQAAPTRALPSPEALTAHCRDAVGEPRIEQPAEGVYVAIGYDLANTILVETDAGSVIIDAGMSPARAGPVRAALREVAPGPVAAVIYTHSHIDHVGGALVWAGPQTPIYATEAFTEHFFKQYGVFRPIESLRGARQFGWHVPDEALPCSALGRRIDLVAATETGFLVPTHTFSGSTSLTIGGVRLELVEAHGETDDQLFVWLPEAKVLMPGDNWYRAFPNLYTIRGTRPRPVGEWIASLDAMRRLEPEALVPSHTAPVVGREAVAEALTRYRDGIQWVHDRAVAAANQGLDIEAVAAGAGLPPALAGELTLSELYGQVDWSARAIYGNQLGWFDGDAADLYPLPDAELARRTVTQMGGEAAVEAAAAAADDPRWALHLLELLVRADPGRAGGLAAARAAALTALAEGVNNANGRAYLLERAWELTHTPERLPPPAPNDALIDALPVALIFEVLQTLLIPAAAEGVHEALAFRFTDTGERYTLTVRRGVLEVAAGEPLPGTPAPAATVEVSAALWKRIALGQASAAGAIASGALSADDLAAFGVFMARFDQGGG